jgi:dolichol kinase
MNEKQKREFFRKTIHVSALILPLSYRYLFHNDRKLAFIVLVPLTLIALVIEIARIEHKTVKRIFLDLFGLKGFSWISLVLCCVSMNFTISQAPLT